MLPVAVRERLQAHLRDVKRQHEQDLAREMGRVILPFAIDRKYPTASTELARQFVFPASRMCRDPRWGPPSGRSAVRHVGVLHTCVARA